MTNRGSITGWAHAPSGPPLNPPLAESLAEALTTNKHLEQLGVGRNALCDDGIQHLVHALRVNQGLKDLNVHSCGMTQGRRKHFFCGQANNINGALARREILDFNYIHDYDVIIIGHERSSKVTSMLSLLTST